MMSNDVIETDALPAIVALQSEPISPKYRTLNLVITGVIFTIILGVMTFAYVQPWKPLPEDLAFAFPFIMLAIGFFGTAIFVYHLLADVLIRFTLREQDLVLHKGLVFKQVICQPILRIQHIDINRGPIQRMAGLATLQVYSAGGSAHTLAIHGLPVEQAETMRQFVLNHKDLTLG